MNKRVPTSLAPLIIIVLILGCVISAAGSENSSDDPITGTTLVSAGLAKVRPPDWHHE